MRGDSIVALKRREQQVDVSVEQPRQLWTVHGLLWKSCRCGPDEKTCIQASGSRAGTPAPATPCTIFLHDQADPTQYAAATVWSLSPETPPTDLARAHGGAYAPCTHTSTILPGSGCACCYRSGANAREPTTPALQIGLASQHRSNERTRTERKGD